MNSYAMRVKTKFSACGHELLQDIWMIVDLREKPEFAQRLREGNLHVYTCKQCGKSENASDYVPLLLFQFNDSHPLLFSPADQGTQEQNQETFDRLLGTLRKNLGPNWQDQWVENGVPSIPRALLPEAFNDLEKTLERLKASSVAMELKSIIEELSKDEQSRDVSRKISLCRRALELLPREKDKILWAGIHVQLASLLGLSDEDDRAENIEKAIYHLGLALEVYSQELQPLLWGKAHFFLGLAYDHRRIGNKLENLKKSIDHYKSSLDIDIQSNDRLRAAHIQKNLAEIYYQLIRLGRTEEYIEQSIYYGEMALEVITETDFREEWGEIQKILGLAYFYRAKGNEKNNIESSINHCLSAIRIYIKESLPEEWAELHSLLADNYDRRLLDNRAENIEQALLHLSFVLEVVNREEFPLKWARLHAKLASNYYERLKGIRAENIEQAIHHAELVLEIFASSPSPGDLAILQQGLGNFYHSRLIGDRADNLEKAIYHLELSLNIFTTEFEVLERARSLSILGYVYLDRMKGDRAKNIEKGISIMEMAFEIYSREEMPKECADIQYALAGIFRKRLKGNINDNIEKSIEYCQKALTYFTREAQPYDWALTQSELALGYESRAKGGVADNLERAIHCFLLALEVLNDETHPEHLAGILYNLGAALRKRPLFNRKSNLELAIQYLTRSLQLSQRPLYPEDWAHTHIGLANAYMERIEGERSANIELAISHLSLALEVFNEANFPRDWATIQHELGIAFLYRIQGERSDNLEAGISYCQSALQVRIQDDSPFDYVITLDLIANLYSLRQIGDHKSNIEQAVHYFKQALEIEAIDQLPDEHRKTLTNLANMYFRERQWQDAYDTYSEAIEVTTTVFGSAFTEAGRRAELSTLGTLYNHTAFCLVKLKRYQEAFIQIERGKTRWLREVLAIELTTLDHISDDRYNLIKQLREEISSLEVKLQYSPDTPYELPRWELADVIQELRLKLNALIIELRNENRGNFPIDLDLTEILSLIPEHGSLVVPLITSQGGIVFVVPSGVREITEDHLLDLENFIEADLDKLLIGTEGNMGWLLAYANFRDNKLQYLRGKLFDSLKEVMNLTLSRLWEQLLEPIYNRLTELRSKHVILMPTGKLRLLPLHAAWHVVVGENRYFLDYFDEIVYTPSAYVLKVCKQRSFGRQDSEALVAGVNKYNALSHLRYACSEAETIASIFHSHPLLDASASKEAIKEQVPGKAFIQLSCNGMFAWGSGDPLGSALILANDEPLTALEIIEDLDLSSSRLVTLSACETGITDIVHSPDEYLGLILAFLESGAPAVLSSLWPVDDRSSALLMEHFYKNYVESGLSLPKALKQAQVWLREATRQEIGEYYQSHLRISAQEAEEGYNSVVMGGDPSEKLYNHPFYWAAFIFSGE